MWERLAFPKSIIDRPQRDIECLFTVRTVPIQGWKYCEIRGIRFTITTRQAYWQYLKLLCMRLWFTWARIHMWIFPACRTNVWQYLGKSYALSRGSAFKYSTHNMYEKNVERGFSKARQLHGVVCRPIVCYPLPKRRHNGTEQFERYLFRIADARVFVWLYWKGLIVVFAKGDDGFNVFFNNRGQCCWIIFRRKLY